MQKRGFEDRSGLRSLRVLEQHREPQGNHDTGRKTGHNQSCRPTRILAFSIQTHSRRLALDEQQLTQCLPRDFITEPLYYVSTFSSHTPSIVRQKMSRRPTTRLQPGWRGEQELGVSICVGADPGLLRARSVENWRRDAHFSSPFLRSSLHSALQSAVGDRSSRLTPSARNNTTSGRGPA